MSEQRVAVVTGASRGVGKGMAIALGEAGFTVYVTGRSSGNQGGASLCGEVLPGTIDETAEAVTRAGGHGIPVLCDHADDVQIKALFERVEHEQGRLDILVNNATFLHENLIDAGGFWQKPLDMVRILDVGLRSAYVASYYAAPLMVRARRGLIAFVSSFGANCYMHGPAYGAQKAGVDKLAADMAVDLEDFGVAAVSLWLGPQLTERTRVAGRLRADQYAELLAVAETPQFNGRIVEALSRDPALASLSGKALITAELAERYGITDNGRQPPSYREQFGAPKEQHPARVV